MANTFTATAGWRYGGGNQKSLLKLEGTLVIDTTASGGAAADDMPASMFGLKKIIGIAAVINDGEDKVFFGVPDYTGDSLMIGEVSSGTPIDLPNDTYKLCIQGYA